MRPRFLLHRFAYSFTRRRYDDGDHPIEFRNTCSVLPTLLPQCLNLPRLKSRDSCFIDRCHCWSYTVSTGVTSGSCCRTD
jgi:hypothetical protein